MVNVGESPYIEHLQEVPGDQKHFEPPFLPYISLAEKQSLNLFHLKWLRLVGAKALVVLGVK